jgi:hypothetical protein
MPSESKAVRDKRAREGPKVTSGGNTQPDAAWIEAVMAAGELHTPDESTRPESFLYDTIYQWDGYADEVNIDFFESFRRGGAESRKCNGTAYIRDMRGGYIVDAEWERLRRPCLARPARGTVVCHSHGAKIPQVVASAKRVLAEASEIVALRLVGMTAERFDGDEKVRLGAINSVLDRAGVKAGVEVEITTPGYKKVLEEMFGDDSDGE